MEDQVSSEEIARRLAETQAKLIEEQTSLDLERIAIERSKKEEAALREQVSEKIKRRSAKEFEASVKRAEVKELEKQMLDFQHALQKAQVEEKQEKRAAEQESKYEEIISDATWGNLLFEHQMVGAKFGANAKRWVCGDTVGLGKTVQAVAWFDLVQAKKILVITPKNLTKNFMDHVQEWAPGRNIIPIVGVPKDAREAMLPVFREHMTEYVVVVNYEAWRFDNSLLNLLLHMQFDTLVCDEAHKMKDLKSLTYWGVDKLTYAPNVCPSCTHYDVSTLETSDGTSYVVCEVCNHQYSPYDPNVNSIENVLLMSGTLLKNKPQEIFPNLRIVNKAAFSNEKEFLRRYCRRTPSGRWTWSAGGEDALTREISPFYLRRRRQDTGIKVPPQKEFRHVVNLDPALYPEQYEQYKTLRELSVLVADYEVSNTRLITVFLEYLLRLRQVVTWPYGIKYRHPLTKEVIFSSEVRESVKIDKSEELIEDFVDNGSRVLLFTKFTSPIDELYSRLEQKGIRPCILDGRTRDEKREEISRNFDLKYVDRDGGAKWDVALCNYGVGSEGLTLTDATDTVLLDQPWNPAEREQATGRTDRIGQIRETAVHQIYCDVWVEEWQDELMQIKGDMINGFEASIDIMQSLREGLLSGKF